MQEPILEDEKKCSKCGELKPILLFSRDRTRKGGRRSWCKACVKKSTDLKREELNEYNRKYYLLNRERIDAYRYEYCRTENAKIRARLHAKRQCEKFPEKKKAGYALNNAVESGKVVRPSTCSLCGASGNIEGHHWSYKEEHRLDVIWLCRACHSNEHKRLRQNKG